MARRSLSFLHNCVQELSLLDVAHPDGSLACWIFLSCLEILLTCEQYSDSSNRIQLYCLYTASLWAYARVKLQELGRLCGLMPDQTLGSEHLHRVVELSAGIRDDHYTATAVPDKSAPSENASAAADPSRRNSSNNKHLKVNPVDKLKEALSSKDAFQKYYLVRQVIRSFALIFASKRGSIRNFRNCRSWPSARSST